MIDDEDGAVDVPDLVPARMVNEFCYCPGLFHLGWVQARFEDNDDTVEGTFRHRAVDRQEGRMPPPSEVDQLRRATSVTVGSERLGLVAVIDLVEQDNQPGSPVISDFASAPILARTLATARMLVRHGVVP